MNFFRKHQHPVIESEAKTVEQVKGYPDIVQEIHQQFATAGEKILQEANDIISNTPLTQQQVDKLELLKTAGFRNSKEVRDHQSYIDNKQAAEERAALIRYYATSYPNNKFITHAIMKSICDKYGLVCGPASHYTGFVPMNNLQQIVDFKLDYKDYSHDTPVEIDVHVINLSEEQKEMYRFIGYRWDENRYQYAGLNIDEKTYHQIPLIDYTIDPNHTSLLICAPEKDMDISGLVQRDGVYVKEVIDPVVLHKVRGSYLIITAWGDEASDPEVVNEKHN